MYLIKRDIGGSKEKKQSRVHPTRFVLRLFVSFNAYLHNANFHQLSSVWQVPKMQVILGAMVSSDSPEQALLEQQLQDAKESYPSPPFLPPC